MNAMPRAVPASERSAAYWEGVPPGERQSAAMRERIKLAGYAYKLKQANLRAAERTRLEILAIKRQERATQSAETGGVSCIVSTSPIAASVHVTFFQAAAPIVTTALPMATSTLRHCPSCSRCDLLRVSCGSVSISS